MLEDTLQASSANFTISVHALKRSVDLLVACMKACMGFTLALK